MSAEDYERESIRQRDNARAVQCALSQLRDDMPSTPTIMDATLLTKIEPVRDAGRIVREARWYVRVIIAHPPDEQDSIHFYRVWRENGEWKSARIEL